MLGIRHPAKKHVGRRLSGIVKVRVFPSVDASGAIKPPLFGSSALTSSTMLSVGVKPSPVTMMVAPIGPTSGDIELTDTGPLTMNTTPLLRPLEFVTER